jgi:hypothetical protein
MATIQKKEREMAQKARAQAKRARKVERRQATAKVSQNPGAAESISPLQNQKARGPVT